MDDVSGVELALAENGASLATVQVNGKAVTAAGALRALYLRLRAYASVSTDPVDAAQALSGAHAVALEAMRLAERLERECAGS